MLRDEVRELLRELCASTGAAAVAIAPGELEAGAEGPTGHALSTEVGGGAVLVAWYDAPEAPPDPNGRAAALERAARAIRASARRWEVAEIPAQRFPETGRTAPGRAHARTQAFLDGLVGALGMRAAAITLRGAVIAGAGALGELDRERLPFTVRRVRVEAERQRGKSSHAELAGDDFYAVTFWYDACLVCFFAAPFALDFVRHRSRQVTRELGHLLAMIDDPDLDPIQISPLPDR